MMSSAGDAPHVLTFGDVIGPKKITEISSYLLKIDE